MRRATIAVLWCAWIGCSDGAPQPAQTAPPPSSGGEQPGPAEAPAAKIAPESLSGLWVEFWALDGGADTQRYALFEDGRFGWRAAGTGAADVAKRWGEWRQDGDTLVLRVAGHERQGGCSGDDCLVRHEPPLEERLVIGECPPNEEAKALDASYRCVSIGGQAFWRRPQNDDPSAYLPAL